MKKLIITLLAFLIVTSVASASLWTFYDGNLPTIEERAIEYEQVFGGKYTGSYEQNIQFEKYKQYQYGKDLQSEMLGAFRPSGYTGKLLTRLVDGGSESTFQTTPDEAADGSGLSTTKLGDFIVFTINPGGSNEEKISVSAVATSSDKATWTIINRGLSFTENASITANIKQHAIGETIIISNDDHYLEQQFAEKGAAQSITGVFTFASTTAPKYDAPYTASGDEFVSFTQLNAVVIGEVGTSTEAALGLVELATRSEQAAGTASSTAGGPLVLLSREADATYDPAKSNQVVVTGGSNFIDSNYIATSSAYTWDGQHNFTNTATTTFSGTTTVESLNVTNGGLLVDITAVMVEESNKTRVPPVILILVFTSCALVAPSPYISTSTVPLAPFKSSAVDDALISNV